MTLVNDCPGTITPLPGQTLYPALLEAIRSCKLEVDAMQYQWNFYVNSPNNPVQVVNQTLMGKVRGGVKCRVLLNKEGRGQHLMAINMLASRFLGEAGVSVKFGRTFPITHAKLWLFDDDVTLLGSHNLSGRSLTVNNEVSVLVKSKEVTGEFRRYFNALWDRL